MAGKSERFVSVVIKHSSPASRVAHPTFMPVRKGSARTIYPLSPIRAEPFALNLVLMMTQIHALIGLARAPNDHKLLIFAAAVMGVYLADSLC
jgi:hypothetical protein